MKFKNALAGTAIACFYKTFVDGRPADTRSMFGAYQIPGYSMAVLEFNGLIDGHQIEANGTVQEIFAQVKNVHPAFNPESLAARTLSPRETDAENDLKCCPVTGQSFGEYAGPTAARVGVQYLRNLEADANIRAHTCVRVSCSAGSGIFVCNDTEGSVHPAFDTVASMTEDIIKQCVVHPGQKNARVCGQVFDTNGFNVILQGQLC